MTWTVEDERRYQELLRREAALEAQVRGDQVLQKADAAQRPQRGPSEEEQKAGLSWTRMIGGGFQDIWNGAMDTLGWVGDVRNKAFGAISGGYLNPETYRKPNEVKPMDRLQLNVVGESTNPWEKTGRALIGFMVPYAGAGRAVGAFKTGIGLASAAGRSLAAATAVNLTVMDATENNLANMLRDDFGLDNEVLDAIATEEDDDLMVGRLKMALSNLPLDIAGEVAVEGATKLARLYKGVRANNEETKALVEATKSDIKVSREAAKAAAADNPSNTLKAVDPAPAPAPSATTAAAAGGKTVTVGADEVVVKASQVKEAPITTLDQFVTEVRKQTQLVTDPAQLTRIADALISEPHEALTLLKIDPAKLDYSVYSDPAAIKAMQNSLGDLVDEIAKRTGKTGIVQSNKETLKAARLLAAQPWNIKKLLEGTKGLASRLTAARIMVGSHAHKLMEAATAATKEISEGGAGKAYAEFIATLETHGHLLGVLRGAGSEIGRGLQSLKMSVDVATAYKSLSETAEEAVQRAEALKATRLANLDKARQAKADAMVKFDATTDEAIAFMKDVADGRINMDRLNELAAQAGVKPERAAKEMGLNHRDLTKAKKAQEAYDALFSELETDAGRLRLLNQLKDVKGDLTKLSRLTTRRQRTGFLQKADDALKDTTGALFSPATAILNLAGAGFNMTFRGMSQTLAALGLKATAMVTGSQEAAIAARKQALKAWATFHVPMQAFGAGFSHAWASLKATGLDELSFVADGLKMDKWAKSLQERSIATGENTEKLFLKDDFQNTRGFSVSPEFLNSLAKDIERLPAPRLAQMGMEWFLRAGGAAINTAGAAFRTGTSLFINAPDQIAGTFATRIGQHTAAIDIAAKEAAEAGLDDEALMAYIKGRSLELGELIDNDMIGTDPFYDGMKDLMDKAGLDYAREVNFSDDIETEWLRKQSDSLGSIPIAGTLIMPFPKTPLRVMERTILDYTPLYGLKKSIREAWASGNAEVRGEIAARWTMTVAMMSAAWGLVSGGAAIGYDGGFQNSARRERASYTIRIFDDVYEFNRLDPIGTIIGFMADIREVGEEGKDNREIVKMVEGDGAYARTLAADMAEAVGLAIFKNILSKAYLDGLEQISAMSAAKGPEDFSAIAQSYFASLGARAVPLSGVQRQWEKLQDPTVRQARGVIEGLVKASFGSDTLPPRRDPIFGRPVEFLAGERLVGLKGGPVDHLDPVNKELARLSFDVTPPKWRQKGVELSSEQMSRFLELRGHTVKVEGMTLEEAVTDFVQSQGYAGLTDDARIEGIKDIMQPYSREAMNTLVREDDNFAFKLLVQEVRDDFRLNGRDMTELAPEAERLAKELGINRTK